MDDRQTSAAAGANPLGQVPLQVAVSVGHARLPVRELLDLSQGAVLHLDRRVDDLVELYVGDKLIARGELQELDGAQAGQLAVCLTEVHGLEGGR